MGNVVVTQPTTVLTRETEGVVECSVDPVDRKLYAIYWFNGSSTTENLIIVEDLHYHIGHKRGKGYSMGTHDIKNMSLVINQVKQSDQGKYICMVSDYIEGRTFENYTNVRVTGKRPSITLSKL